MPIPETLAELLEGTIRSFMDHGVSRPDFLDEARRLASHVYKAKPGAQAKHNKQSVFDALTAWRNEVYSKDGRWPSQNQMATFIAKKFGYSSDHAKDLAKVYRLLHLKSYAALTKADRFFLKNNYSREWRESENLSKAVTKLFSDIREAELTVQFMREIPTILQSVKQLSEDIPILSMNALHRSKFTRRS